MKVDDFIKDLAINLNRHNANDYKQQASAMVLMNSKNKLNGEEVANLINIYSKYDDIIKLFPNTKSMLANIKIMMEETSYALQAAFDIYEKHPKAFNSFNNETKNLLFKNSNLDFGKMPMSVFDEYLEFNDDLWKQGNMTNPLGNIMQNGGKPSHITKIVNHKKFSSFPSHYKLRDLLNDYNNLIANKKIFDKVYFRQMEILASGHGWNTDFVKELAPIIKNKYFTAENWKVLTPDQIEGMKNFAKKNIDIIPSETKAVLFDKFQDTEFISEEAKDLFIF